MLIICYDDPNIMNASDASQRYAECENIEIFKTLYPYATVRYVFNKKQNIYESQAEFATVCEKYGFSATDYHKVFTDTCRKQEFRFIRINTKNKKYKCTIEDIHTHKILKTTPEYVKYWMHEKH